MTDSSRHEIEYGWSQWLHLSINLGLYDWHRLDEMWLTMTTFGDHDLGDYVVDIFEVSQVCNWIVCYVFPLKHYSVYLYSVNCWRFVNGGYRIFVRRKLKQFVRKIHALLRDPAFTREEISQLYFAVSVWVLSSSLSDTRPSHDMKLY